MYASRWWDTIITLPNGKKSNWSKVAMEHRVYEMGQSQHRVVAERLPELHEAIHKASNDTCVYAKRSKENGGKDTGHQKEEPRRNGMFSEAPTVKASTPLPPNPQPTSVVTRQLGERLAALSPHEFEVFVGKYLEKRGLKEVQVTGRSHDGGIDGTASEAFLGVKVAFQAKKWAQGQSVRSQAVQALRGSMENRNFERGILITTSSFTDEAEEEARLSQGRVILVDGQQLAHDCIDLQLGVKPRVVEADIDEEFFSSL